MGLHIGDNKLVITTDPKTFRFDFPKDLGFNFNVYEFKSYNIINF